MPNHLLSPSPRRQQQWRGNGDGTRCRLRVRVVLEDGFAVRSLDLLQAGILRHSQNLVKVQAHAVCWLAGPQPGAGRATARAAAAAAAALLAVKPALLAPAARSAAACGPNTRSLQKRQLPTRRNEREQNSRLRCKQQGTALAAVARWGEDANAKSSTANGPGHPMPAATASTATRQQGQGGLSSRFLERP